MKKLRWILLIPLLCISCAIYGQNTYVIKNDTLLTGVTIVQQIGRHTYLSLILKQGDQEVKYTPDVISEFSDNGTVYKAVPNPLSNNQEKVFMEVVVEDEAMTVYYFVDRNGRHLFYKERNAGQFLQINKDQNPYADYIYNNPQSPSWLKEYRVKPTKSSIRRAHKICITDNRNLIIRNRFGLWLGGGFSIINNNLLFKDANDTHLFIGAFADIPIYREISFHPELFYMKETNIQSYEQGYTYRDATFNHDVIILPLLLRYSFINKKGKILPYLQAGPTVHYNLKKEIIKRATTQITNGVETVMDYPENKSNFLTTGFSAGLGIEYKLTARRSFFFDVRYLMGLDSHMFYATVSVNL